MKRGKAYDKASWHLEGAFLADLPDAHAYVHAGLLMGWLLEKELIGERFRVEWPELVNAFRERQLTGPQVYQAIGGVLTDEDLSERGNAFAQFYFDVEQGRYSEDYLELLAAGLPSDYHVADTWENFEKLCVRIDDRFSEWSQKVK